MTDVTWSRDRLNEQLIDRLRRAQHREAMRQILETVRVQPPERTWEDRQDLAREVYEEARRGLRLQILWDARCGRLSPEWRAEAVQRVDDAAAGMAGKIEAAFFDAERLAAISVGSMEGLQPWEPSAGVGWRAALDGWYAAITQYDSDAITFVTDCQRNWILQQDNSTSVSEETALTWARNVELYRRIKDQHGVLYYAGLACGGVTVDWRQWFRERIATWLVELEPDVSEPFSRRISDTLDQLEAGVFDSYEMLPDYWLT